MAMHVRISKGDLQEIVINIHTAHLLNFHWPGLMSAPSGSLQFFLVSEVFFSQLPKKQSESLARAVFLWSNDHRVILQLESCSREYLRMNNFCISHSLCKHYLCLSYSTFKNIQGGHLIS